MAGAILWAASSSGKLNGVIAAIGASGKRRVRPQRFSPCGIRSIGMTSPRIRRASSAPWRNTKIVRSSSVRAAASGFPASAASRRASSSRPAETASAIRSSRAARAWVGMAAAAGAAVTAAAIAASTSAGPASAARPTTASDHGLRISHMSERPASSPASRKGKSVIGRPPASRSASSGRSGARSRAAARPARPSRCRHRGTRPPIRSAPRREGRRSGPAPPSP